MNIFQKIKNSYFKCLKGEENFWVVLFWWGVPVWLVTAILMSGSAGSLGSIILELLHILRSFSIPNFVTDIIFIPAGILGIFLFISSFVYPLFFSFLLIKNSKSKGILYKIYMVLIALIILAFCFKAFFLNLGWIFFVFFLIYLLVLFLIMLSKSSLIIFVSILIIIIYKIIIKHLSTKTPK